MPDAPEGFFSSHGSYFEIKHVDWSFGYLRVNNEISVWSKSLLLVILKKRAQNYKMVILKKDSDLPWRFKFFLNAEHDFSFKISISFKTSRSSIFRLRPPRQIAIWPWWNFMKIWKSRIFFGPSTAKSLRRKSKMTQTIEGEKKTNLFRLLWLAVGQTRRLGRH